MNDYYVYIMTNKHNTTLYIGVTNDISRRAYEHRNRLSPGFTKRYNLTKLVYTEHYENIDEAISREKQLKNYCREWKFTLIKNTNPTMDDLYDYL